MAAATAVLEWRAPALSASQWVMRILYVHAHFDDYEFTAAGTFELWRRKLGPDLRAKVLVCTDGAGGHQFRTRAETARLRLGEQMESARLGGYEFELLRLPDGTVPREASLQVAPPLLAALWKSIRDFEPDYLFCPPAPADPLSGVHIDHVTVAEAVRRVAYLINVPHAFTPEYPEDETQPRFRNTPAILTVFDGYQYGESSYDLAVDIGDAFSHVCKLSYCHRSQICEWLPWVGRHAMRAPASLEDWSTQLGARLAKRNAVLGVRGDRPVEVFTVTAWGALPTMDQLRADLPHLHLEACHFGPLEERLARWSQF